MNKSIDQSVLQKEANEIVTDLRLFEQLSKYGDVRLVGSVALGTIVKLDIDLHLLVKTNDLLGITDKIYHELFDNTRIRDIRISDYRKSGGIKIGIDDLKGKSGIWKIDIWITDRYEATGFDFIKRLGNELTSSNREIILDIKRALHEAGFLGDGISNHIYEAVIFDNVTSVAGLRDYLSRHKIHYIDAEKEEKDFYV